MPPPDLADYDESRTLSVGVKRTRDSSAAPSSGYNTPNKRSRRHRVGHQEDRDFVPKGCAFSKSEDFMQPVSEDSDGSISPAPGFKPDQPAVKAMTWNEGVRGTIRTSLRGGSGDLGRNRLSSGFPKHGISQQDGQVSSGLSRTNSNAKSSAGESQDDAIEISDDTDMENDSEGGMMINLEGQQAPTSHPSGLPNDDSEDEGLVSEDSNQVSRPLSSNAYEQDAAHNQLQVDLERSFVIDPTPATSRSTTHTNRKLADLSPTELETQIKYTMFHMDRSEIDLNRLVVCRSCLEEGHKEGSCPENRCVHCGEEENHSSKTCPRYRRCLKCRQRGHDVKSCTLKLKDSSIPCDDCGSSDHLENTCPLRFFPARSSVNGGQVKLWISCCNCSSNTHLVGDCPRMRTDTSARWSLRSLDPQQITNMSLESGTRKMEKEVMNRGMRPQGLKIKGRAGFHQAGSAQGDGSSARDDDVDFIRPRVGQSQAPPRVSGQIRFNQSATDGRSSNRGYLDPTTKRYDRFEAPNSRDHYSPRERGEWYSTDSFGQQRRRSRSPDSNQQRSSYRPTSQQGGMGGYGGVDSYHPQDLQRRPPSLQHIDSYRPQNDMARRPPSPARDHWRPPLPREPLPEGPPPPGTRAQLPTRQGSNQWVKDRARQQPNQNSQGPSPRDNAQRQDKAFQPMPQQSGAGNNPQSGQTKPNKKARKRAAERRNKGIK